MTRKKTTKYALLSSVMAMVLSVAMLMGTTFAWFTDTASTAVNKIQAGTLDVALEMSNDGGTTWENAEGKTLEFIKAPGQENEPVLWEPGCTYKLPQLRVVNKGNLALKYNIFINGVNGDAKLLEVIEWTYDGMPAGANGGDVTYGNGYGSLYNKGDTSPEITISGHMKETAGNEYQGLSIDGISITVYATQRTSESDSTDNKYDQDSSWIGNVAEPATDEVTNGAGTVIYKVSNGAELAWIAQFVNSGAAKTAWSYNQMSVVLENDIDLNNVAWTPIGNKDNSFTWTFDGQGKTIYNLNVTGQYAGLFGYLLNGAHIKNVNIENAVATGTNESYAGALVAFSTAAGGVTYPTIENCSVKNVTATSTKSAGALVGSFLEEDYIKDCSVDNAIVLGQHAGGIVGTINANVAVIDCTVANYYVKGAESTGKYAGRVLHNATVPGDNTVLNSPDLILNSDTTVSGDALTDITHGKAGLTVSGNTLDGNGKTLTIIGADTTYGTAVYTTGGTIKNITINGAFRGIFSWKLTSNLVIDNVTFNSKAYTLNFDDGNGKNLIVTNSTLNGWTSYTSNLASVSFTDCNFGSNGSYAYLRPYCATILTNCDFATGFELDATKTSAITLVNCTYNGTPITTANLNWLGADAVGATVS